MIRRSDRESKPSIKKRSFNDGSKPSPKKRRKDDEGRPSPEKPRAVADGRACFVDGQHRPEETPLMQNTDLATQREPPASSGLDLHPTTSSGDVDESHAESPAVEKLRCKWLKDAIGSTTCKCSECEEDPDYEYPRSELCSLGRAITAARDDQVRHDKNVAALKKAKRKAVRETEGLRREVENLKTRLGTDSTVQRGRDCEAHLPLASETERPPQRQTLDALESDENCQEKQLGAAPEALAAKGVALDDTLEVNQQLGDRIRELDAGGSRKVTGNDVRSLKDELFQLKKWRENKALEDERAKHERQARDDELYERMREKLDKLKARVHELKAMNFDERAVNGQLRAKHDEMAEMLRGAKKAAEEAAMKDAECSKRTLGTIIRLQTTNLRQRAKLQRAELQCAELESAVLERAAAATAEDDAAALLREQEAREQETRDREAREREAREQEVREREARERETREREAREQETREQEAREREASEREAREEEAREQEARIMALGVEMDQLRRNLQDSERRIADLTTANQEFGHQDAQLNSQVSQLNGEKAQLVEQIARLTSQSAQLDREKLDRERYNTDVVVANRAFGDENAKLTSQVSQLSGEKAHLQDENAKLWRQILRLNDQNRQLEDRTAKLMSQIAQTDEHSTQLDVQIARLDVRNLQLDTQNAQLTGRITELLNRQLDAQHISPQSNRLTEQVAGSKKLALEEGSPSHGDYEHRLEREVQGLRYENSHLKASVEEGSEAVKTELRDREIEIKDLRGVLEASQAENRQLQQERDRMADSYLKYKEENMNLKEEQDRRVDGLLQIARASGVVV